MSRDVDNWRFEDMPERVGPPTGPCPVPGTNGLCGRAPVGRGMRAHLCEDHQWPFRLDDEAPLHEVYRGDKVSNLPILVDLYGRPLRRS
jgi:hypothetical protein